MLCNNKDVFVLNEFCQATVVFFDDRVSRSLIRKKEGMLTGGGAILILVSLLTLSHS